MLKTLPLLLLALVVGCAPTPRGSSYLQDNQTTVTSNGKSATENLYHNLKSEQTMLGEQINSLNKHLGQASRSKSKKLNSQIGALSDQLAAVERRLATFPQSLRDPSFVASRPKNDSEFRQKLVADAQKKVEASDPYAGPLSEDKDLDKIYRSYINNPQGNSSSSATEERVYRVLLITSSKKIDGSKFKNMQNVFEQQLASKKGYAYYQGNYSTETEAKKVCRSIISKGTFRGAIVVAMVGDKRVDLF